MANTTGRRPGAGVDVMSQHNRKNTPENDATGEIISWVVIFILMFAFPPVGLLMLIIKLRGYAKPGGKSSGQTGTRTSESTWRSSTQTTGTARETGDASRQTSHATGDSSRQTAGDAGEAARKAVQEAEAVVREVAREIGSAARDIASEFTGATRGSASHQSSAAKPAVSDTSAVYTREFQQTAAKKSKKRKDRNPLEKKTGKFVSTILLLIAIALFVIGANTIVRAAIDIWSNGLNRWPDFWLGVFYFFGALIPFFSRNIVTRRFSRYKKYYAFTAGRDVVPMPDIARSAGLSTRVVARDIQAMINAGYFGTGSYIDNELDSLVLSAEAAEAARRAIRSAQDIPVVSYENPENQYMAIILELRDLNDTIIDISISDKIDRIEETTAKIFRIVEDNPAKLPQIRRFMNYYLPTTLKLLRSYATLEKQGIKGENITAAKENIGRVLDTLSTGFEQQLDQLFESDAIDIAADINVLENLMQQDGLTGDKPEMMTMEGTS